VSDVETLLDEPQHTYEPRLGRRRWVAFGSVLVVVAALGWFGWWLRHPASLEWGGYGIGDKDQALGEPVWTSLSEPARRPEDRRVLTFEEVRPVMTSGRGVDVDYFICSLDSQELSAEGVGAFGYGLSQRWAERMCADLRPAEGMTMDLVAEPGQQLLVRVTLTRPGLAVLDGHEVEFSEGWQTGTQTVGPEMRFRARR
jgi:hypothetical protein